MITSLQKREQLLRLKDSILLYYRGKGSLALLQLPTSRISCCCSVKTQQQLLDSAKQIRYYRRQIFDPFDYAQNMSQQFPPASDEDKLLPRASTEDVKKATVETFYDRVFSVGNEALRTRSVLVIQPTKQRHKKQKPVDPPNYRCIRVTTSSTMPINEARDFSSREVRFNVKPLIILDLNGILCYRIRRQLKFADQEVDTIYPYRPQLGPDIAQTPIIPRPDVASFMEYIDEHFCVAIWTSARAKTANALIKLLIPEPVRDRLLFVWSQTQCEANIQFPESTVPSDLVYRKNLSTVWQKFPLWSTANTLLVDDSPDKCIYHKENSIHPPSLNGRHVPQPRSLVHPTVQLSDEENVAKQLEFMQKLVHHWHTSSVVQTWDSRNSDFQFQTVTGEQHDMKSFLAQHATGHMGYHVPTLP